MTIAAEMSGAICPSGCVASRTKRCSRIAMMSCGVDNPLAAIC
jgi:hypothetical protein